MTGDLPNVEANKETIFYVFYLGVAFVYCLPYAMSLPAALARTVRNTSGVSSDGKLFMLADNLKRRGAIWVILPKSARTVTKANVFAAAREVGMQQVKVLDFTDNRAAYKIVRPATTKKGTTAAGKAAAAPA